MNIRNRAIAVILTLCIAIGLLPAMSFGSGIEVEAATSTSSTTPTVKVYPKGTLSSQGMTQVVSDSTANFTMSLWHYSGGYWAASNHKTDIRGAI